MFLLRALELVVPREPAGRESESSVKRSADRGCSRDPEDILRDPVEARTMSATAAHAWRGCGVLDFQSLALALWEGHWIIVTALVGALAALLTALLTTPLDRAEPVLVS